MSWDMKTLKFFFEEEYGGKGYSTPKGRIALTMHTMEALSGDINNLRTNIKHNIPAGTVLMLLNIVLDKWGRKYASVFWEGRTIQIRQWEQLYGVIPENKFDKLAFAVTGTLSKQREFYKTLIKLKGGTWKNSVSSQTDILIVGKNSHTDKTSKHKKAIKLGIKIINEDELRNLLHQ